jgi:hypothetical protein
MTGALNMSSTKKRARSPEIDGPPSTRQSTSVQILPERTTEETLARAEG